jgi:thymidylate kinase
VAFEGPDGSGKTTQRKLFKAWMRSVGHEVVTYKWNSSPLISPILKA